MTRHGDPFGGRARRTGCGPKAWFFLFLTLFLLAVASIVYPLIAARAWEWFLP